MTTKRQIGHPGFYKYTQPQEYTLEADDDEHVALLNSLGGFPRAVTLNGQTHHIRETQP
jgi:hypothetical protein